MVVGGCWPAMDTAMELMVADQQWRQPLRLVVAGQQSIQQMQQWNSWLLASNGESHAGYWFLASNGHSNCDMLNGNEWLASNGGSNGVVCFCWSTVESHDDG